METNQMLAKSTKDCSLMFDGRSYIFKAGVEIEVPYGAAKLFTGDYSFISTRPAVTVALNALKEETLDAPVATKKGKGK